MGPKWFALTRVLWLSARAPKQPKKPGRKVLTAIRRETACSFSSTTKTGKWHETIYGNFKISVPPLCKGGSMCCLKFKGKRPNADHIRCCHDLYIISFFQNSNKTKDSSTEPASTSDLGIILGSYAHVLLHANLFPSSFSTTSIQASKPFPPS